MLLRRDCAVSVLEGVLCVLELLESMGRILEALENCALHAIGTAGDALCAEALDVVLHVLEVLETCVVCRSVDWKL